MKNKLSFFLVLLLTACSSVKYNYIPESTIFSIPDIGATVSSGLGEPLLDQGKMTKRDILYILEEKNLAAYKITPGKLIKVGTDLNYDYFIQDTLSNYSIYEGLLVSSPSLKASLRFDKKNNEYCILRPGDINICGDIKTITDSESVITNTSFRRTLIYSGRVGNKLKISYREFNNNMVRSAFNSEVEYDLNESNVIGYAGARIEIITATNTEITYKVISDFKELQY